MAEPPTYYTEHREERLAYGRTYYAEHREERLAYARTYYAEEREERLAYTSTHAAKNSWKRRRRPVAWKAHSPPIPDALAQAALSGMPERWYDIELPPGQYVWHCKTWQRLVALPHTCPYCHRIFFTQETPPCS